MYDFLGREADWLCGGKGAGSKDAEYKRTRPVGSPQIPKELYFRNIEEPIDAITEEDAGI